MARKNPKRLENNKDLFDDNFNHNLSNERENVIIFDQFMIYCYFQNSKIYKRQFEQIVFFGRNDDALNLLIY